MSQLAQRVSITHSLYTRSLANLRAGDNLTFSFVSVKMKWNANNSVDFLKIYEQHPA